MAKFRIEKDRNFDYDDCYEIDVRTTKRLTKDEYMIVINAIEVISGVFDEYLDKKRIAQKSIK